MARHESQRRKRFIESASPRHPSVGALRRPPRKGLCIRGDAPDSLPSDKVYDTTRSLHASVAISAPVYMLAVRPLCQSIVHMLCLAPVLVFYCAANMQASLYHTVVICACSCTFRTLSSWLQWRPMGQPLPHSMQHVCFYLPPALLGFGLACLSAVPVFVVRPTGPTLALLASGLSACTASSHPPELPPAATPVVKPIAVTSVAAGGGSRSEATPSTLTLSFL